MGEFRTVMVDGSEMNCYLSLPSGASAVPVMEVLHGGFGFDQVTQQAVDRLAEAGIAAIGPDLFHRGVPERPAGGGPRSGSMRVADFLTDVDAALAFASGLDEVDGSRLGVMGFCMGGQVSYLTAGNRPNLSAVVAFYPGFVFNRLGSDEDPAPYDFTENIVSPILVLSGQDDTNPSPAQVETIDADLTRRGAVHEVQTYPGAAHAFMSEGEESYHEHAATDGWKRCLAWLDTHL